MSRLLRGRHRRADLPSMLIALDEVLAAAVDENAGTALRAAVQDIEDAR